MSSRLENLAVRLLASAERLVLLTAYLQCANLTFILFCFIFTAVHKEDAAIWSRIPIIQGWEFGFKGYLVMEHLGLLQVQPGAGPHR